MSKGRIKDSSKLSSASPMPSYASGHVLYSTSDSLTSEEIDDYFRIIPSDVKASIDCEEKSKRVNYLRPVSFEEQQREMEIYRRNRIEMNSNVTFYEKKQMFPIDETAYAKEYQKRFDDEFVQHWNRGLEIDVQSETTISQSNVDDKASVKNNELRDDLNESHLSDIEGRTDVDGSISEVDEQQIRQLFGVSHALDTFDDYREIQQSVNPETELPIHSKRKEILSLIESNSILIIQGATGCGKSTQIPQFILDDHVQRSKAVNIVVTQPRRIAARALCEHICRQRRWPIGQTVGYQTSLNKQRSELTRILFCTTGTLLQKLVLSKTLQDYTHIILDEVHERDQSMDFLFILIRTLWLRNSSNVKIILMSATMDTNRLANYFRQVRDGSIVPAEQYFIGDHLFDVQDLYLEHIHNYGLLPDLKVNEARFSVEAIDLAVKLIHSFDDEDSMAGWDHTKNLPIKRSTVLVFLPGLLEIQTFHQALRFPRTKFDSNQSNSSVEQDQCQLLNYEVIPLHANLTIDDQMNVFATSKNTFRKIILSTNVAESSITIADVRYVIDFCLNKEMIFDRESNYSSLQLVWASKSNCEQRRGRAGRCSDGKCYRLVKSHLFNSFAAYRKASLLQESLERVVLQAKQLNIGEPKSVLALALDPPNLNDIELTILKLKELGGLTIRMARDEIRAFDGNLTFLGKIMAALPIDIELSRLIGLGHAFGLVYETVVISACLSTKSLFKVYYQDRLTSYKSKFKYSSGTFCDFQTFLNVYKTWRYLEMNQLFRTSDSEDRWSKENNIDLKRLREVHLLVDELRNRLKQLNIFVPFDVESNELQRRRSPLIEQQNLLHLKIVIAGAFYPNYYIRESVDCQSVDRDLSSKDPKRTIFIRNVPLNEGILYRDQIERQVKEMLDIDSVDISFESSKGLIEFNKENSSRHNVDSSDLCSDQLFSSFNSRSTINPFVYFSVKARTSNHKIKIETFERSAALQRLERIKFFLSDDDFHRDEDRIQFEQQRNAFLHLLDRQNRTVRSLPSIELPDMKTQYLTLNISTVVDCNHFWAQYTDRTSQEMLEQIDRVIDNACQEKTLTSVEIGTLCLAPFHSSPSRTVEQRRKFYRARVIHRIDNQTVQIIFIDWGNIENVRIEQLRSLDCSLLDIAPLAFECYLWSIKVNSARYPSNHWPVSALNFVCSTILEKQVQAEIKAVARNIVKVDIILDDGLTSTSSNNSIAQLDANSRTTLRQLLINKGFGEPTNEEHLFEHDYRIRRDAQRFVSRSNESSTNRRRQSNRSLIERRSIPTELCQIEDPREIGQTINLTGPYSPLETSFSSCHCATKMRRVQIDSDSINSVSLDEEQEPNSRRLLVAFGVHLSSNKQFISLRHTSLMPSIRGLNSLIAMIFAPSIELRLDGDGQRKTGVLCGLGFNQITNTSLFADHDMDLPFDVEITTDDLVRINEIRAQMNLALFSAESASNRDLIRSVRRTIHVELQKLIEMKRTPMKVNYLSTFQWNKLNPEDRVPKICEDLSLDHLKLFPLHDDVLIRSKPITDEHRLKMMYHLIWLREQATITSFKCQITCELCQTDFHFTSDLFSHLSSAQHRQRVKLLNLTLCL